MAYNKVGYVNFGAPDIDEANLNRTDKGVAHLSDYVQPSSGTAAAIVITTENTTQTRIFLEIPATITGSITINRNGGGALVLYTDYALTEQATELEAGLYEIQDRGAAFLKAPKGGGLAEFFGDGSDGALNTVGNVTLASVLNGPAIIKQYTDINVNIGDTLTVSNPCQGLVLYASGNVTIDGAIDMSAKAGYAPNANVIPMLITNFKTTDPYGLQLFNELTTIIQTLKGGSGGNGGYGGGNAGGSFRSIGGSGGPGRQNLGGFGGGGGGGVYEQSGATALGGYGGSFLYAEFSGGLVATSMTGKTVAGQGWCDRIDGFNGAGGRGAQNENTPSTAPGKCFGAGGGGGTSRGSTGVTDGAESGGFILIIAGGNITINGQIVSAGSNGGTGGVQVNGFPQDSGGGGGGGAGGGVIAIFHKGTITNNGTVSTPGGSGGAAGTGGRESGGAGSSGSVGTVKTQQL